MHQTARPAGHAICDSHPCFRP